jgi:hypothetical protein
MKYRVDGVLGCQPEGIAPPGAAAGESARVFLQLGEPGRVDIVKPVKKHAAHGDLRAVR